MCSTSLLLCLTIIAGTLATNGDDLNLKSIFRTPKDFSKVNFDHFELLERNNFDDQSNASPSTDNPEVGRTEDKTSSPIANAQVMLRIGGEEIHDCNRVILRRPYTEEKRFVLDPCRPRYSEPLPLLHANDIRYPCLPHAGYSYLPPPPFFFPGPYYTPKLPNYCPSSYQRFNGKLVPSEFLINSPEVVNTIERPQVEQYLEVPAREKIVCEVNAKPIIVKEPRPCENQVGEVEIIQVPNEPSPVSEEKYYVDKPEPTVTTVVDTSCKRAPVEEISTPECITINTIHTTTVHPNPRPTNVAYVEVNLADAGKPCLDTPKDNIASLVDQALVPLSCQKCSQTKPLLVSYPVIKDEKTVCTVPEEQVVSECPKCSQTQTVFCESCNRERNPNIPYGQRFSKDVDSLFEIVDNRQEIHVPSTLYNDSPSEHLIKIHPGFPQRKLKRISTVVPVEDDCSDGCPQKEVLEVVNPCPDTIESPCATQEVVQECNPCSETVTTIESPCVPKAVEVEQPVWKTLPTEVPSYQTEWATEKVCEEPCHQKEIVEIVKPCHQTIEVPCAPKKVVHVSKPCQEETFTIQPVFEKPNCQVVTKPCPVVEVHKPCLETVLPPHYITKEISSLQPYRHTSGCNARSDSQYAIDLNKFDRPNVYLHGHKTTWGSEYYSDPEETIYYKHPTTVDSYEISNPVLEHSHYYEHTIPVVAPTKISHPLAPFLGSYNNVHQVHSMEQHETDCVPQRPKISEPHIYKIVAKYDIIPRRDIKTLNIPDLVPTDQYLKVNVPTVVPERPVCRREFVPVDAVPLVKNVFYIHGWPFWRNVPVQREVPLAPSYIPVCRTCAKYRGELNELAYE